jgi:hypothetical protein
MSFARLAVPLLPLLLLAALPRAAAQPAKPIVIDGKLTKDDPLDRHLKQSHHKVHELQLDKGQAYLIDLEADLFDAMLRIEDAGGKGLAGNDDIGVEDLNARLVFIPPATGKYRAVVTTAIPKQTGAYRLGVYPTAQLEKPQDIAGKLTQREHQSG